MLAPDDPIQKALFGVAHCQSLLKSTVGNLSSPSRELRHQAEQGMRHFGELEAAIVGGKSRELNTGADVSIAGLAAAIDELQRIAADSRDKARSQLATKALNAMDVLALRISKASGSPFRAA